VIYLLPVFFLQNHWDALGMVGHSFAVMMHWHRR